MTEEIFKDICLCGETTKVQFKLEFTSQKEIAKEMKQGSDKRRITENAEILALFQDSGSYQADAVGVNEATFDDLDRYAIDDYLQKVYNTTFDGFGSKAEQVLRNIHVLNHNGIPTLAGYLFFGKHPEYKCPTLMVKAVSFFGNYGRTCITKEQANGTERKK